MDVLSVIFAVVVTLLFVLVVVTLLTRSVWSKTKLWFSGFIDIRLQRDAKTNQVSLTAKVVDRGDIEIEPPPVESLPLRDEP